MVTSKRPAGAEGSPKIAQPKNPRPQPAEGAPKIAQPKRPRTPRGRVSAYAGSLDRELRTVSLPPEPVTIELETLASALRSRPRQRLRRHSDLAPSHPGALLREIVVPATGRSKTELAELLGVSRQTLHDVLTEKAAVTPNLALRLDRMFGNGPEIWLRMQAAHDVWHAARVLADELAAIPRVEAAP